MEKTAREEAQGRAHRQPPNTLQFLREFNRVLWQSYRGDLLAPECVLILAVIRTELEKGNFCKRSVINSQVGKTTRNGMFIQILERHGLINRVPPACYSNTINGEILLNSVIIDLDRILQNKPTKPKRIKPDQQRPRQRPPIETFEELVKETLNKKGLSQRVKYALLRALGMKANEAKQAVKAIAPMKHTEKIKPVLKNILTDLINNTEAENTKG